MQHNSKCRLCDRDKIVNYKVNANCHTKNTKVGMTGWER